MIVPDADYRPNPTRAIYILGPIDEQLIYRLTPQIVTLQNENRSPITVYIDSPGGNTTNAEFLWRLLNASNQDLNPACNIITVVTSRAASAAADLLSSGNYAIAFPQSTILYHGVRMFRDTPLTVETTSLIESILRSTNETYAMDLMRKIEFRFMLRFLISKSQFKRIRNKNLKQMTDAECFQAIIFDNLSGRAKKLFETARARQERYDALLDIARKSTKCKIAAKTEASRIKAIVDFEVKRSKKDPNWTFRGGGLTRLNEDFFLLNEHLASLESDRLDKLCISWGKFALSPPEKEEIDKSPEASKNEKLVQKVRPLLEPLWSFFVALCHTLQEGENELTATDAFWLGLIDEVMGVKELSGYREIAEYKPDPPKPEPSQIQAAKPKEGNGKA